MELTDVIEELIDERGLDRAVLCSIISEGMLTAYAKKYPTLNLKVECDKKNGNVLVFVEKEVVSVVEDDATQISIKKARFINKDIQLGEKMWLAFDKEIGRIEVLWARQAIASRLRKIEVDAVYNEFKDRKGEIVLGIVNKCERNGIVVMVGDTPAFLPEYLSIPEERFSVGYSIRALLTEVLPEPRADHQLILDRASEEFLVKLFELEIPEVFEGLIEIKKIVRIPGYKSKIVVASNDINIDPVGTCVGVGGSRIKPMLKEIGNEKIDIIASTNSLEVLLENALKPAKVESVSVHDGVATVILDDEQRSLAIGKKGQNISLASRLTGVEIQLSHKQPRDNSGSFDLELL